MNLPKLLFRLMLGRRLPTTAGALKVSGIRRPVSIRRDDYGIAYIDAEGDEDAWYGLGFCHGQDRAFQLESLARLVRGTLAELAGAKVLPLDRLSRRIGFRQVAEQQLDALGDEGRHIVEAYARGITDGARVGCRRRAHEFALLRTSPTPFRAADALGSIQMLSFSLASNWDCELIRLKILNEDGPDAVVALDPACPEWLPVTAPTTAIAGSAVDRLADDLALFTATVGLGGGSNNWAIAASRTATGRPILANDPHLPAMLPSYWYLAHVRTPQWATAGASFVGAPFFAAGHNGTIAWGVTAGFVDNTDLFLEEIGPDRRSIREGDGFVACQARREVIEVRRGKPVEEEVLLTRRGPIIGPALDGELGAVSLGATWLKPRPVDKLLTLPRARSFDELRHAFDPWPAFSLNVVTADTTGAIGWQLVGDAPQRRKGSGTMPLAGWDPQVGWHDTPVPFDDMPHAADPEVGFLATANNQPTPAGEGPFLSIDWMDGYRRARIAEAIEARHDWDPASAAALQMDQMSLPWRELRDVVLNIPADNDALGEGLELLREWDSVVAANSAAAAVFELLLAEMIQRIVRAKAPRAARWALGRGFPPLLPRAFFAFRRVGHLVRLVRAQPHDWFDRPWPDEIADALSTVIRRLRERHGSDPDRWAWGNLRPLTLRHSFARRAALGRIFNLGPFPWGGDTNTVSAASADPADPTSNPLAIASLRMVLDVGNWDASRFALPGGQSGNPLSPHYADLLPLWQQGESVPIAWSPAKVDEATKSVLRLEPEAS